MTIAPGSSNKTSTILQKLDTKHFGPKEVETLHQLEENFRFSFQQIKQVADWWVDCKIWQEQDFWNTLDSSLLSIHSEGKQWTTKQKGDWIFNQLKNQYKEITAKKKTYPSIPNREEHPKFRFEDKELKGNIYRRCPATSDKGVCCGLQTLNLVENCAMGCSYCVLQSHYDEAVIKIPTNLKQKLSELHITSEGRTRITTGEYSDSLLWGNANNMLADLIEYFGDKPHLLLEFKTKSINIDYLLKNPVPKNVVCSWSLNPQNVIDHEERKTAPVQERLNSARKVADKGIGVGFHLHPMIYYEGWEEDYSKLIQTIQSQFSPQEILWVSLGTITYPKGLDKELRSQYNFSKIWQIEHSVTEDGKITYAYEVRKKLFTHALNEFSEWKDKVYFYLCMEYEAMFQDVLGYSYRSIPEFNEDMCNHVWGKLGLT